MGAERAVGVGLARRCDLGDAVLENLGGRELRDGFLVDAHLPGHRMRPPRQAAGHRAGLEVVGLVPADAEQLGAAGDAGSTAIANRSNRAVNRDFGSAHGTRTWRTPWVAQLARGTRAWR